MGFTESEREKKVLREEMGEVIQKSVNLRRRGHEIDGSRARVELVREEGMEIQCGMDKNENL